MKERRETIAHFSYLLANQELQREWAILRATIVNTNRPEYNAYNWIPFWVSSLINMNKLYTNGLINDKQLAFEGVTKPEFALLMKFNKIMLKDKITAVALFKAYTILEEQGQINYKSLLELTNDSLLANILITQAKTTKDHDEL